MKIVRWVTVAALFVAMVTVQTAVLIMVLGTRRAEAATTNRSVANGNISVAANWELGHVPDNTEKAVVRNAMTVNQNWQVGALTINDNKTLTFLATSSITIQSKGNVIVEGTLVMHPSSATIIHKIAFTGVNEANYQGGGDVPINSDDGLWVTGDGVLDLVGTAKTAWNRTGDDATWANSDDLVVTPTAFSDGVQDDNLFDSFTKGGSVPSVTFASGTPEQQTYSAEVLNLTRNVKLYGGDSTHRAHVWIKSTAPQTLDYVEIRYMGPRQCSGTCDVLGRYGLHFHKDGTANDGRTYHGLVVRDSGSHAYAVHMSDGITLDHAISYNTYEDAYWWDPPVPCYPCTPDPVTNDFTCDYCVAALVRSNPVYEGYRLAGFNLGAGANNTITNSVAVGVQGNSDAAGFVWPEFAPWNTGIWTVENNLAHNNSAFGATVWQVNSFDHQIVTFDAYHNGKAGVLNGAYGNAYLWDDLHLYSNGGANDDTVFPQTQFLMWAGSTDIGNVQGGRPWTLSNSILHAGGRTDSALILAGRAVISLQHEGGGDQSPGDVLGNTFRGYNDEAVLFSAAFFEGHSEAIYKTQWHLDANNDYGSGTEFWCDDAGPGVQTNSVMIVDGVGTLHPSTYGSGTFHPEWNCKVT